VSGVVGLRALSTTYATTSTALCKLRQKVTTTSGNNREAAFGYKVAANVGYTYGEAALD
jgi:hypothetical protein